MPPAVGKLFLALCERFHEEAARYIAELDKRMMEVQYLTIRFLEAEGIRQSAPSNCERTSRPAKRWRDGVCGMVSRRMAQHPRHPIDWRQVLLLLLLMCIVILAWNTWAVYPLKILVVFFHELSHALAAWATGGHVVGIQLEAAEGGLCTTAGGNAFAVLTAGYLGSLIWGGVILNLAARTQADKAIAVFLGVLLLAVTAWLVRPVAHFGFLFGALTGLGFVVCGLTLPHPVNDVFLRVVGLTSCLYAVLDIKSDVLYRPQARSDAFMLAELTKLPVIFWGVVWFAAAIGLSGYFLLIASRARTSSNTAAAPWTRPTG